MKTTFLLQLFIHRSRPIAAFACCLTFLFTSARPVQAQFTGPTNPGTNYYRLYAYDQASSTGFGTDPESPVSGGNALSPWVLLLPPTGLTHLPVSVSPPMGASSCSLNVNFVNNPTGLGLILILNNPNSQPAEVRFDWAGVYNYTGPSINTPAPYSLSCSGSITGGYWEVANGETFYDITTGQNYTSSTASVGGAPYLYSGPPHFSPAGSGPWLGSATSGAFSQNSSVSFSSGPNINLGDGVLVSGYVDVILDPGTVQVQIGAMQPPTLGIGTYSNSPVVFYPSNPGTNYTLQMTSNLGTGPWAAVTNGVPFTAVQVTNAPNPAFFRLQ